MQTGKPRRAILYAAKSTEDTRGSIPGQLEDCRASAAERGLEVIAEYSEQDVSAYNGNRGPELAAALSHANESDAALVVQHSDRLARGNGRKARHLVEIALWARKNGVEVLSVQDPSTFENLVLAAVMGERNMEDSRRKSAAVAAGIARRRAAGRAVGGRSYGFDWRGSENDERELMPNPDQAPIVERIFDEFLQGVPKLQIAKTLNADGVPTLKGRRWAPQVIDSILGNPLCAGLVRDGDRMVMGRHQALVSRRRWEEVQSIRLKSKKSGRGGRPSVGLHLFRAGMLHCGICGAAMIVRSDRRAGSLDARNLPLLYALPRRLRVLHALAEPGANRRCGLRLLRACRP